MPGRLNLIDLLRMTSGDYKRLTRGAATSRAKRPMWKRNAAIALGNAESSNAQTREALSAAAGDENPLVSGAASDALRRV